MNDLKPIKSSAGISLLAALFFSFGLFPTGAWAKAAWGKITYQMPANVGSQAGTLLVHFRMELDPYAEPGAWFYSRQRNHRFFVADLRASPDNPIWIYWRGSMWTHITRLPASPGANLVDKGRNSISAGWQTGEQHWAALTWNADGVIEYWLDGIRADSMRLNPPGIGPVTSEGILTLGSGESAITVYGVHILDHALTENELQNVSPGEVGKLFQLQEGTLLLDRFDQTPFQPDGVKQTRALSISGISGEMGGVPTPECRFVDTPHGFGLRLYTPPEDVDVP